MAQFKLECDKTKLDVVSYQEALHKCINMQGCERKWFEDPALVVPSTMVLSFLMFSLIQRGK